MLQHLLEVMYNRLTLPGETEFIVVDNDASGSATEVFEKFEDRQPVLRGFNVPIQNISLARNRAVAEARGEWIAMIDDDEVPNPDWLLCLHQCATRFEADAVFGPVLPHFPKSAPQWIIDGGFFDRARYSTGTVVGPTDARTGNVLIRADAIKGLGEPFNPDFGLSGGEDSMLFRDLIAEGKRLVWCDNAEVREAITKDRLNGRWLIRRWFRGGQTFAQSVLRSGVPKSPSVPKRLWFVIRSILLAMVATAMLVLSIPFGKKAYFSWVRVLAIQAGKLCPPSVFMYKEYQKDSR
jgi:succinoglycan biosynthesis protein ExoM